MDQMVQSLLSIIINVYIFMLFVRMFTSTSERFDAVFGMVFRATDPVVTPLGSALRTQKFDFAPAVLIVALLLLKGIMFGSIPKTLQSFANLLFQLYVLIIIIISSFSEFYTNPIASFGQRLVNPIRAVAVNFSRNLTVVNILSVVLLIIAHGLITILLGQFSGGLPPNPAKFALLSSLNLILSLTTFFIYVIIGNALLSWVNPDPLNPIVQLLSLISAPIVEPLRRVIPPIAGAIDISPIIAIFALSIAQSVGHQLLQSFA